MNENSKQATSAGTQHELPVTNTCSLCGAWRGELGLEPTPELYVQHIVEVLSEVKRVLRNDGTLWLNLGDSYASGKGTCYNPGGGNGSLGKNRKEAGAHPLDRGNKSTLAKSLLKPKDLVGIPWMVAFALRSDGWWLRSDIIWSKPNPMPESVQDRPTRSHEYIFLLTKSAKYYYGADAIREPLSEATLKEIVEGYNGKETKDYAGTGAQKPSETKARIVKNLQEKGARLQGMHIRREEEQQKKQDAVGNRRYAGFNERWDSQVEGRRKEVSASMQNGGQGIVGHRGLYKANGEPNFSLLGRNARSVWTITTKPFPGAHFATFPPEIPERCIKAGSRPGDTILDPFAGSGTTLEVAERLGRDSIGIELNEKYVKEIIEPRMRNVNPLFTAEPEEKSVCQRPE